MSWYEITKQVWEIPEQATKCLACDNIFKHSISKHAINIVRQEVLFGNDPNLQLKREVSTTLREGLRDGYV